MHGGGEIGFDAPCAVEVSETHREEDRPCQIGALGPQRRAARVAISVRTSFAPCLTAVRVRPIVPTIPRGSVRPDRCASSFVRSVACRSHGRSPQPTSRSRCTPERRRAGLDWGSATRAQKPATRTLTRPRFGRSSPDSRQHRPDLAPVLSGWGFLHSSGALPSPGVDRASLPSYMFRPMFWPLAGGLIAFVLLAVLLGWILDPSRRGDADGHGH